MKYILRKMLTPLLVAGSLTTMLATILTIQIDASGPMHINVSIYVESDTGFTWVRTYTGPEENVEILVAQLRDSYSRLAESMGAGSALKIYVQGLLVAESSYEGSPQPGYSGVQITVHDTFAQRHQFSTTDAVPGPPSESDEPVEPYICGK